MNLKVAIIQLKPSLANISFNIRRATEIVDHIFSRPRKPDLIILPELALTGYNFNNVNHIKPYLEDLHTGIKQNGNFEKCATINWAIETSKKFKCFTVIGYPEIYHHSNVASDTSNKESGKIYNSACLISPIGSILYNYRKSFLYETDKVWGAQENPHGFESFELCLDKQYYFDQLTLLQEKSQGSSMIASDNVLDQQKIDASPKKKVNGVVVTGEKKSTNIANNNDTTQLKEKYKGKFVKTAMGICMDLSHYEFKSELFEDFEFANYCFNNNVQLILFPMAWLSSVSPSTKYSKKSSLLSNSQDEKSKKKDVEFFDSLLDQHCDPVEFTNNINAEMNKSILINDSDNVDKSLPRTESRDIEEYDPNAVCMGNLNYWILRSVPLYNSFYKLEHSLPMNKIQRVGLFCNRVGIEDDVVYCGSSSIIEFKNQDIKKVYQSLLLTGDNNELESFGHLSSDNASVNIIGSLPTGRESVLLRDINIDTKQ